MADLSDAHPARTTAEQKRTVVAARRRANFGMKLPSTSARNSSQHAAAEKPEKQRAMIRFAPVAFLKHPNRVFASFALVFGLTD
jgi:hypothetical protein